MAQFQLGSISTGTLRTLDLLEAFASEAEARCGDMATKAVSTARIYLDPDAIVDDEQAQETLDELRFLLEDSCPPFVYFGTLEGDGADFGFWADQNAIDDFISEAIEADLITVTDTGDEYHNGTYIAQLAHDTENVTVMDMERNIIWSAA